MSLMNKLGAIVGVSIPIWILLTIFGTLSYQYISERVTPLAKELEQEFIEKNEEFMYSFLFRQGAERMRKLYGGKDKRKEAEESTWISFGIICFVVAFLVSWLISFTLDRLTC